MLEIILFIIICVALPVVFLRSQPKPEAKDPTDESKPEFKGRLDKDALYRVDEEHLYYNR